MSYTKKDGTVVKGYSRTKKTKTADDTQQVKGYTKKNGTYVAPHRQTNPDHTQRNNYSTRGNVNPYTGKAGTRTATH